MLSTDLNRAGISAAFGTLEKAGSKRQRTYWPVRSAAQNMLRNLVTNVM